MMTGLVRPVRDGTASRAGPTGGDSCGAVPFSKDNTIRRYRVMDRAFSVIRGTDCAGYGLRVMSDVVPAFGEYRGTLYFQ